MLWVVLLSYPISTAIFLLISMVYSRYVHLIDQFYLFINELYTT